MNPGLGWPKRVPPVGVFTAWGCKEAFVGCISRSLSNGTAKSHPCDAIGLQMRPLKEAAPELEHSLCQCSGLASDTSPNDSTQLRYTLV